MTCYIIPSVAAIVHKFSRNKIPRLKNNVHHKWLNMLFLGGAIFGLVDHAWNKELFIVRNLTMDLLLGVTITAVIFITWIFIVTLDKKQAEASKTLS